MESQNATCNSVKPEVPYIPLLLGLTIWAVLKLALEGFVRNFFPSFYADLKLDIRRKYNFYFGTWIGIIFKSLSIASCSVALLTTSAENDIVGLIRPFNAAEQLCWGCRAVIYIQELPDVAAFPELVIHHVLSIAAMVGILAYNLPRRQLYLLWATLHSEILNNVRRILKMHDRLSPRLAWWIALVNSSLIWIFRIFGAFVALVWTLQGGIRGIGLFVYVASMLVYIIYMLQLTSFELSRYKILNIEAGEPSCLVIAERWRINLLGMLMGLGLACTEISALLLYEKGDSRVSSEGELHSLSFVALQATVVGLIGTYLLPRVGNVTGKGFTKLSLHGGFLFAGATILLSPTLADTVDRTAFASCLMMSFPLIKSITQYGRSISSPARIVAQPAAPIDNTLHFIDDKKCDNFQPTTVSAATVTALATKPHPGLQRIASYISAAIYLFVLAVYLSGGLSHYQATGMSLALQAAVDINIQVPRDNYPIKKSLLQKTRMWATMFHRTQADICMACVTYYSYLESEHGHLLSWELSSVWWFRNQVLFVVALLAVDSTMDAEYLRIRRTKKTRVECTSPSGEKGMVLKGPDGKALVCKPRETSSISGLRGVSILCGFVLCSLIASGAYFDMLPTQTTDIKQAQMQIYGSLIPETALWGAASSWQFAISMFGVIFVPILVVQFTS